MGKLAYQTMVIARKINNSGILGTALQILGVFLWNASDKDILLGANHSLTNSSGLYHDLRLQDSQSMFFLLFRCWILCSYPVQYEVLRRSDKYFSSSLKCVRNRYDLSHILGFRVELYWAGSYPKTRKIGKEIPYKISITLLEIKIN